MGRGACTFREGDLRRAIQATTKAGKSVQRVEIGKDGKLVIILGESLAPDADDGRNVANDFDAVT